MLEITINSRGPQIQGWLRREPRTFQICKFYERCQRLAASDPGLTGFSGITSRGLWCKGAHYSSVKFTLFQV